MNTEKRHKLVNAAAISALAAVVFTTVITITADLTPPLKDWLKNTFSHHWVGKSIIAGFIFIILAIVLYVIPSLRPEEKTARRITALAWITLLATLTLFGFYLYETFGK